MHLLRATVRRVVREQADRWSGSALSEDEAQRLAGVLIQYIEHGTLPPEGEYDGAERTLVRRLIELTRAELLNGANGLRDGDLLRLLRKLEGARERFEPQWHQTLASQLMGASALDLVVELAHDLRSPLTSIMFLSETLRKGQSGEINEVQRKQLGIVYSAALGLVSVASDVIDLAKEKRPDGRKVDRKEPFSLSELLDSVRVTVAPMAEEKRLDLRFLTPEHDVRVGMSVPLSRVLLNLTTNAIKFTEEGLVEIVARETTGQRVEFSVRDTGRGMDDEALAGMFRPFHRSRSSTGYHFSGTGLGLSICRRMVEVMGGELGVESGVGQGTRFFFEIELPRGSRI
ncbi:MAG TPA: HAMP domain-containing sensor histidine kinase [Longimicrobiales bacterium]|nr:HAMP domain-containing sensor histidine kinase [Longimicrobiales bacterium]